MDEWLNRQVDHYFVRILRKAIAKLGKLGGGVLTPRCVIPLGYAPALVAQDQTALSNIIPSPFRLAVWMEPMTHLLAA